MYLFEPPQASQPEQASAGIERNRPRSPRSSSHWQAYLRTFSQTHWLLTREVERHYDSLRESQWLDPAQLRDLQNDKLGRLLHHAFEHVPFYRERMRAAGLRPEDIRGQADLVLLPFLTKADVREHLRRGMLSDNHDPSQVLQITTSGSTGEPFVCFADRTQLEFRWAATLRSQEWTGYEFGDPTVRLWHQTLGMTEQQAAKERLDAILSRRRFIPVFEMSDARLDAMVADIAEWQPVLIDGYAEAFDFLAKYLGSRGDTRIRSGAVMSSAQTLPEPSRRRIEAAFGCEVFDKYGAREFSGIAYECEAHRGHHVVGEGYIVEILRDGRPAAPGEVGEVVITDLNNAVLPFIRYRIGDLAVAMDPAESCPCGRALARIGAIEGRVQSIILGSEGRYMPGTFFAHYLKEFEHAISLYQVVQRREGAIALRLVKARHYSDDVLDEILATFRCYLGDAMRIEVEFVDHVEMVRTGKRLASVSHLPVDFQARALQDARTA